MSVLDDIIVGVRDDLERRRARVGLAELEAAIELAPPASPVLDRFREPHLSVIAEIKRSSPSKGHLAEIAEPRQLAAAYEEGGAAAISVLTEQRRFNGSLEDLRAVRNQVSIPVLRKEFMVDEYQFFEARAYGADLILLIVAALDDATLARFHALASQLGMTCLVETHTPDEIARALDLGAELIGINNRNLKTLQVDLATFAPLAAQIGSQAIVVAESGISGVADARRLASEGADVVLVGEALVKHGNPQQAVAELTGVHA